MQLEIKEVEFCKFSVHYEEGMEEVLKKTNEVSNRFKHLNVPGFRPGKAPLDAIQMHYRKQINDLIKQELAENAYYNVLFDKKFKPFGKPVFNSLNLEAFKFSCDFDILTKPDFELKEYKDIEVTKRSSPLSVDDFVQKMLEEIRYKHGDSEPFGDDDFVQMGDNLILNYQAKIDGELIKELSSEAELLTVGSTPLPGFDDNLLGMKASETRTFIVNAPPGIKKEFADKKIEFTVTFETASRTVPAALDDNLAKKLDFENFDALKKQAYVLASEKVKDLEDKQIADQVLKQLVENHDFKVPSWLVGGEARMIASNSGISDWNLLSESDIEMFTSVAERNVKLSLILEKIRENEPEAQLSDEEALNKIKSSFNENSDETKSFRQIINSGYAPFVISRIRDEHTINYVISKSKIVE